MLEDFSKTAAGCTVAADTAAPGQPDPPAQPQHSTDSRLAGILQRQSAGDKLSAADRGYLGAVKRKGTPKKVSAPASENILLQVAGNPENELFEQTGQLGAESQTVVAKAVNSDRLQTTANSIVSSLDILTQMYIAREAREAGADADTVARHKTAVALQPENRKLIIENSEPMVLLMCEWFGCTPEKLETVLKNSGLVGAVTMHALTVITALKSIRESKAERAAQPKS